MSGRRVGLWLALGMVAMAARSQAGTPLQASCAKVVLTGEVNAGQEWREACGEGWVFRVLPIQTGKGGVREGVYSGWDLAVDRGQLAGFSDALLVATPLYNSINEREVGTTFGLQAQDAIGWNIRSFRFLISPSAFRESQKLYHCLGRDGQVSLACPESAGQYTPEAGSIRRLLELAGQSSAGMFRIVDGRLTPGVADAAPYAENWALQSAQTPHTYEPAPGGEVHAQREAGLDAVFRRALAAGCMEGAGRTSWCVRRLFRVRVDSGQLRANS
ncbi:MAG: hypothetical protein ABSG62_17530 [Terracidiphilus sp.]